MGEGPQRLNLVVEAAAGPFLPPGCTRGLDQVVVAAMTALGVPGAAVLSLVLTGDDRLQDLNRHHRSRDEATDVLSFPAPPGAADATEGPYLGDIVVSVERAASQASGLGHSLGEELNLLAVHGLLHLLGHDHSTAEAAAKMEALERKLGVRR